METLKDFSPGDLEKFKHVLLYTKMKEDLPRILRHQIETADRVQTVKLMVLIYGQRSEEVIREVFNKMNRRDLVQRLSDISSGSEGRLWGKNIYLNVRNLVCRLWSVLF